MGFRDTRHCSRIWLEARRSNGVDGRDRGLVAARAPAARRFRSSRALHSRAALRAEVQLRVIQLDVMPVEPAADVALIL